MHTAALQNIINTKTSASARNFMRAMRGFVDFCIAHHMMSVDPLTSIKLPKMVKTGGWHTWTEEEIGQYREHHAPGTKARITMSFDEYWLEVTTEYRGKPLVTSAAAPSHEELLADATQLTRLAAVMIRRLATRLTTDSDGDRQRIRLGFEH